jgi:predicted secreted protein
LLLFGFQFEHQSIFMNKLITCAVALAFAAMLSGAGPAQANARSVPPTVSVNTIADNQTFVVPQGTPIELKLQENISWGYAWNLADVQGLSIQSLNYKHNLGAGRPGATGNVVITFVAAGTGTTTVTFAYSRPGAAPARTFTITVIAQ